MINISKCNKTEVLKALYEAAHPQGRGFLHYTPKPMTTAEAERLLANCTYFDYVNGRVMKVDLSGEMLDPYLYDRDNGHGAAYNALKKAGLV